MEWGGWRWTLAVITLFGATMVAVPAMAQGGSGTTGAGTVPGLPFMKVGDDNVEWGLTQRLSADPGTSGSKISVSSHDGVVTLTGVATSDAARARAIDMAHGMAGVASVNDQMQVGAF
jgi:hypothetical protein